MFEEALAALDQQLAAHASADAALRLRLGQALEVVSRGAHFDLGFPCMAAYVLERCEWSVRWAEGARCLARRLELLPEIRRAVALGSISWSMGEVVASVATPRDEASWLEAARHHTVRQLRMLVREAISDEPDDVERTEEADVTAASMVADRESEEICTLTCTVDQEEAWLFEATRTLLEHLGVYGSDAQMGALLAEAQESLLGELPSGTLDADRLLAVDAAQRRWREEIGRVRAEAEACCEGRVRAVARARGGADEEELRAFAGAISTAAELGCASFEGATSRALDASVRELARALARQELELSRLILRFHRLQGWRRLGYATEAQYARERLGMSRSSMIARRSLAARLEQLPLVADALGAGRIGVEAAKQIARVATPATDGAWVERAQQRTIKYLREEVGAALVAVRLSGEVDCPPPADAEVDAFHELERAVISGRACQSGSAEAPRVPGVSRSVLDGGVAPGGEQCRAWHVMLGSLAAWLDGCVQMSAGNASAVSVKQPSRGSSSAGRVKLRLRVSRETQSWWRELEAQALRWLPPGTSWLRFLCSSLWGAWRHTLGQDAAYGQIYVRDRCRCRSPVCNRTDVTPHHLQFRSAGGSDEDDNVVAVCTWCHLYGVHGGRIRAVGTARQIRWELGARERPCVVVEGRQRVAA